MQAERRMQRAAAAWVRGGPSRFLRASVGLGFLAGITWLAGCGANVPQGEIHFADGLEQLALGDSVEALQLLERANYELRGDSRVLLHIGRLQAAQGTWEARARARQSLLEAIDRTPRVGLYHAALGELLREQRFMRASTNALVEALRLDPRLARAWCLLGQNLLEEYFADLEGQALLDSAFACYERALELDPKDPDARYGLAFLCMHRGDKQRARVLLRPWVARDCPGRFGLLLASVEFHAMRFDTAQALIDASLRCMSPREREEWVGLRPLLHPDSLGTYGVLTSAARDSAGRIFWWNRDPTPTTLTNERFVEHLSRAVEAQFYFEVPWLNKDGRSTDRGEIYQRYGPPSLAQRLGWSPKPMWEWRYRGQGEDVVFHFVDSGLNGNFLLVRRGVWADFSEPLAMEALPEQSRLHFTPPDGGWKHVVRQFRGLQGRTALEIAYEFQSEADLEGLLLEAALWRGPGDLAKQERYNVRRGLLYDLGEGRNVGRMRLETRPEPFVLGLQLVGLERAPATAPDAGAPGAEAPTLQALWRAFARDRIELRRFDPERLGMSDLLLAHELDQGHGGLFDMGGVLAVPRVGESVRQRRIDLYFEIYPSRRELQEATALAVRYEVRPLPPKEWSFWDQLRPDFQRRMDPKQQAVVQATFTFVPQSDLERQSLGIDLSALRPGPYELVVELVDTASGVSTQSRARFDYDPGPS